jgi:hypothetical protein
VCVCVCVQQQQQRASGGGCHPEEQGVPTATIYVSSIRLQPQYYYYICVLISHPEEQVVLLLLYICVCLHKAAALCGHIYSSSTVYVFAPYADTYSSSTVYVFLHIVVVLYMCYI